MNWEAVSAIATTSAVIVALFRAPIMDWLFRPRLVCRIDRERAKISVVTGAFLQLWEGDCHYVRLWIENRGRSRAEKVQVFAAKLERKHADRTFRPVKTFLPMNLRWSHSPQATPEIFADGISPLMGKHCDVASLCDPENPTQRPIEGSIAGEVTLDLLQEVFPNTQSHRQPPGEYRLTIRVGAANAKPTTTVIELNVAGKWYADGEEMRERGFGAKIIA